MTANPNALLHRRDVAMLGAVGDRVELEVGRRVATLPEHLLTEYLEKALWQLVYS